MGLPPLVSRGCLASLAGLAEEEPAVLLGLLNVGAAALAGSDGEMVRAGYRRAGDRAFKAAEENRMASQHKAKASVG